MEMSEIFFWCSIVLIPIAVMIIIKKVYDLGKKHGRKEKEWENNHRRHGHHH